jgi:NTP pyrophosphatase (non-canonical NTP hydrolase)
MIMTNTDKIVKKILAFRDDRDWKQFHNPKDLAISLVLEAGEVMEHFQWKNKEEVAEHGKKNKEEIGEELADVYKYLMLLAYELDIDIEKAVLNKMKKDGEKYPIDKSKGKHTKYNKL